MKRFFSFLLLLIITMPTKGQSDSPYRMNWRVDAPLTVGLVGTSYWGNILVRSKDSLSASEVRKLDKSSINQFDRFSAGNYNEKMDKMAAFPFFGSFAMPFLLLADPAVRGNAAQVGVLYLQTMAYTGTLWTFTASFTNRKRPFVYDQEISMGKRTNNYATNSFFAGHTAATATATFFFAKVYHDFNPGTKLEPWIWGISAAIPAFTGYLRLKSGNHFLSDNLIGYGLGAGIGVLVPHLHKVSRKSNITLNPILIPAGDIKCQGIALNMTF